jgi:AcrR family transcriptional regulator
MAVTTRRRYSPRMPREQRREQLLDVALELLTARGFGGLTMEGVAREAKIAKPVVYDLFGNREELLHALLQREQERALSDVAAAIPTSLDGEPLDLLSESLSTVLEAVRTHPDTWRLILLPAEGTPPAVRTAVDRHRDRLVRQIEPMVAWGVERLGLGRLEPELTAETILALFENAIRLTLTKPESYPPERIAAFVSELVAVITRE